LRASCCFLYQDDDASNGNNSNLNPHPQSFTQLEGIADVKTKIKPCSLVSLTAKEYCTDPPDEIFNQKIRLKLLKPLMQRSVM
jgi:hypothetical protein